jgi:hypothetical protein
MQHVVQGSEDHIRRDLNKDCLLERCKTSISAARPKPSLNLMEMLSIKRQKKEGGVIYEEEWSKPSKNRTRHFPFAKVKRRFSVSVSFEDSSMESIVFFESPRGSAEGRGT